MIGGYQISSRRGGNGTTAQGKQDRPHITLPRVVYRGPRLRSQRAASKDRCYQLPRLLFRSSCGLDNYCASDSTSGNPPPWSELGRECHPHQDAKHPSQPKQPHLPPSNACARYIMMKWPPIPIRVQVPPHSLRATPFPPRATSISMNMNPQQQKTRDGALSSLSVAIEAMNLAKEVSSMTPAKAIFGSVSVLLTMIKVRLQFHDDTLRVHVYPGLHGQQNRLGRARASLRRCI